MSAANEYPLGGDLTDDRVSGLLHSTLERLSRRTASNTTYITHVNEAGPKTQFSSACGGPLCLDLSYDASLAGTNQTPYGWTVNYGFASGRFYFWSTGLVTGSRVVTQYRYRRNTVTPEASLTRAGDGSVSCQNNSMRILDAARSHFDGAVPAGSYILGEILFTLPENFKGFKSEGIELDLRGQATGLSGTSTIATIFGVYMPHCTDTVSLLTYTGEAHVQNTAPGEIVPTSGTADTYDLSTHRLTAKTLGDIWRPGDTVKLYIACTSDHATSYTSLALYVGALKVNYKE
tara:strand:- start:2688 stop:3557 length:870 start_codon:yes stop_codon:yes gene_type:complete